MTTSAPVVTVVPEPVDALLRRNIPEGVFRHETMLNLFGVSVEADGMDVWVITHSYKVAGQQETFANVNTLGVRYRTQIVTNGLTACAHCLGLEKAQPVGVWHTHPDAIAPQPSMDDLHTYRQSADLADLDYWLAPIACRRTGTRWLLWERTYGRTVEMPRGHVQILPVEELDSLAWGLRQFCSIRPAHLLVHLEDLPQAPPQSVVPGMKRAGSRRLHTPARRPLLNSPLIPPLEGRLLADRESVGARRGWWVRMANYVRKRQALAVMFIIAIAMWLVVFLMDLCMTV